jgi:hypothetical protein
VIALDALAMLLSAALLFAIQPMIAKAVLPTLGGSAAVWTTCLAFFQAVLLAGYLYAYALLKWLRPRWQVLTHLLLTALAVVPLSGLINGGVGLLPRPGATPTGLPTAWLLAELASRIGLPMLFVSATAPLLQGWVAGRSARSGRDPYFLYAASNLGSLLALLSYPVLVEPSLPLSRQAELWKAGLMLLGILVLACGIARIWQARDTRTAIAVESGECDERELPGLRPWLGWVALAFVPSSLLLGVTLFLTTDIAPIPLLWVVPLSLYLLTFIAAFSARRVAFLPRVERAFPIALMALTPALAVGLVQPFWIPLHLIVFTLAALGCHGALAARRPPAAGLGAFYVALALGGALGGLFNAILAPILFDRLVEYRLALVLAAVAVSAVKGARLVAGDLAPPLAVFVLIAATLREPGLPDAAGALAVTGGCGLIALACWFHRARPLRFALTLGAVLAAFGLWTGRDGRVLRRERGFYGTLRVTRDDRMGCVRFFHGSTMHGEQSLDPRRKDEPRTYFTRSGPVGRVFEVLHARQGPQRIGVVGLGCGTLASYARPGDRWAFYELDPDVARIAEDHRLFTYLADCRAASCEVHLGDGRAELRKAADHEFDLIVLDAFSSDAVPAHLLTREALRIYARKAAPDGLLALNLSNDYLDLEAVVAALVADAGWVCRVCYDLEVSPAEQAAGKRPTIWAVAAPSAAALGGIAEDPRWRPGRRDPRVACWTDSYSNLFGSLSLGGARARAARRAAETVAAAE